MRQEGRLGGFGGQGVLPRRGRPGQGGRPSGKEGLPPIPATRLAGELGNRMVANVIMLGFLSATSGVVSRGALEEAIRTTVKLALLALNLKAFACGFEYAPVGARAW